MEMIGRNYKYFITSVVLILVVNLILIFFGGDFAIKWYVYAVSCLIALGVLKSRGYTISLNRKGFKIRGIFKVFEFSYSDIERVSLFQDRFFYKRTLGVVIYLKDKTYEKYFIGTLPSSERHRLQKIFEDNIDGD